jgi:hypothetical protein
MNMHLPVFVLVTPAVCVRRLAPLRCTPAPALVPTVVRPLALPVLTGHNQHCCVFEAVSVTYYQCSLVSAESHSPARPRLRGLGRCAAPAHLGSVDPKAGYRSKMGWWFGLDIDGWRARELMAPFFMGDD